MFWLCPKSRPAAGIYLPEVPSGGRDLPPSGGWDLLRQQTHGGKAAGAEVESDAARGDGQWTPITLQEVGAHGATITAHCDLDRSRLTGDLLQPQDHTALGGVIGGLQTSPLGTSFVQLLCHSGDGVGLVAENCDTRSQEGECRRGATRGISAEAVRRSCPEQVVNGVGTEKFW